ncbi:MAG: DUF2059 domain-containing protein [Candidatus Berkiella sp.]
MNKKKYLLSAVLFLVAHLAIAASPTPSHVKKVEQLLEISHFDTLIDSQINNMTQVLVKQPQFAKHEQELKAIFQEIIDVKNLKKETIQAYTDTFSESEVDEMIKINKSPLGQKIINKTPQLTKQLMNNMQTNMAQNQKKLEDLMLKIAKENKENS